MTYLETGETTLRRYIAEHHLITPLDVHKVHEEVGPIHPDVINFGNYFAQLFNRGGTDPVNRVHAPGLLTRVYNSSKEENRPFVFVIGAGGSTRLTSGDSNEKRTSARDFILFDIIGWNEDQIMTHREIPLSVRITHRDTLKTFARNTGVNNDVPIPDATWENVLRILKPHIEDTVLSEKLAKVEHLLPKFVYEDIILLYPIIEYLRNQLAEGEARELANLLNEVRQQLRRWGIGSRFKGTGRLKHCKEYVLPSGLFFTSPGVEVELPYVSGNLS